MGTAKDDIIVFQTSLPDRARDIAGADYAIFMDRDGTLNVDVNYLSREEDVELAETVEEGIQRLLTLRVPLIVVSNQSAIGRGMLDRKKLEMITRVFLEKIRKSGGDIDAFYYCPHLPEEDCDCRKPETGMLLRASGDFGISLETSIMMGDRVKDLESGWNCNMTGTYLIKNPTSYRNKIQEDGDFEPGDKQGCFVVNTFSEAVSHILGTVERQVLDGERK